MSDYPPELPPAQETYEIDSSRIVLKIGGKIICPTLWKYEAPLFHKDGTETEKQSAEKCEQFRAAQDAQIFDVLHRCAEHGATAKEIGAMAKLTDVQVSRRTGGKNSMESRGLIHRKLKPDAKHAKDFIERGGCSVWFKS